MKHEENKRQVTLEDLLHLKRIERPSPEFWVRFERELRAKQLAAIVARRPWWHALPTRFSGLVRYRLPLGASAILAFTLISVREYQSIAGRSSSSGKVAINSVATPETSVAMEQPIAIDVTKTSVAPMSEREDAMTSSTPTLASISTADESNRGSAVQTDLPARRNEETSSVVPWLVVADQPEAVDLSPTARSIVDNLTAAKQAHPELTNRFFGSVSNFEKRALPSNRQTVDPLAQMRSPGDLHRERLLASAIPASTVINSRSSERVARHISDERLTEEAISRFDARGDRVLVKF